MPLSWPHRRRLRRPTRGMEPLETRVCPSAATLVAPSTPLMEGERAEFQIVLAEPAAQNMSFTVQAISQSARASIDFSSPSRRPITIRRGETSVAFAIQTHRDHAVENDETFTVLVRPSDRRIPAIAPVTVTIQDNTPLATLTGPSVQVTPGSSAVFTLQYAVPAPRSESFRVSTINESAALRTDFGSPSQRLLRIRKGATSASFAIPITARTASAERTFSVALSSTSPGVSAPQPVRISISASQTQPPAPQPPTPQPPTPQPPSSLPVLNVADTSVLEGNTGTTQAIFTASLSAASSSPITVNYVTENSSASLADQDYVAKSGTLTFAAGQTSQTISVAVIGDTRFETNETFSLRLSSPVNATLARTTATATIVNDDVATILPGLSIDDVSLTEGNAGATSATFTVTLTQAVTNSVTVAYSTADGTATTADGDYVPKTGAIVFAPGQRTQTVTVLVNGDVRPEPDETFSVFLYSPINATLSKAVGTATIRNDDAATVPLIAVTDVSVSEGNSGTRPAVFTVMLSTVTSNTVRVRYATRDGSATVADNDYTAVSGELVFAPGEQTKTVSLNVLGDTKAEANEVFELVLSSPSNATLLRSVGVGTISNDDAGLGSWTIMVYMTGDDLNHEAHNDINEMENALVGLPLSVNIAVSWDQPRTPTYSTGNGSQRAWNSYGRAILQDDPSPLSPFNGIMTPFEIFPGDRNTGDPNTLVEFVTWATRMAPAERYVLMMWGHGGGLLGSNWDKESGNDELTIPDMVTALGAPGMPVIDILGYDSCVMGMTEVAYALSPFVRGYFAGSQEDVPGYGHDYTTLFASLRSNPHSASTENVARGIVDSFAEQRQRKILAGSNDALASTYSAIRSSALPTLASALRSLVETTRSFTALDWAYARIAANSVHTYGSKAFGDLGQLLDNMALRLPLPTAARQAAAAARLALNASVTQRTTDLRSSNGLSIYVRADGIFDNRYYADAPVFIQATGWAEFIYMLNVTALS